MPITSSPLSLNFSEPSAGVPEPAGWILLVLGSALLAWRKKTNQTK
ncbi:MAG: PEP-CTERM sorting domain-containing protein [Planctomycetaceae bacterium]|nr:PEP-CTERM sorting domain-containing protein [Planctomycetaceae bacterium]MBQ2821053.1 PEP-CTERM sorting domain-containing protein [Thermoguttaceae bacterium]